MARTNTVSGPIFNYMKERQDQEVTTSELEKALSLTHEQVLNGMNTLRAKRVNIEAVVKGSVYALRSGKSPGRGGARVRLFEEVSVTKTGKIVLKCEDGTLYVATEIE